MQHPAFASASPRRQINAIRWATHCLFPAETLFATCSLRHSRTYAHAPRRVLPLSVRRMCLQSRVAIGFQGSSFATRPSIFNGRCRAAPVASVAETLQPCSASAAAAVLLHATASAQILSLRLAHPLGCRHTQAALRCTTDSLPPAPSRLVAQARLRRAVPNFRWSGQAGSNVPQSTTVAACRSP